VPLLVATVLLLTPAGAQAYLYWQNGGLGIGRANLNGSVVDQSFITHDGAQCGLAASGSYLYWAVGGPSGATTIGRASIDGTGVNNSFIRGASDPCGLAIAGGYIYWGNNGATSDYIGRANLNGSDVDQTYIATGGRTCGLAIEGPFIYWAGKLQNEIGRANLNGTGVDPAFIATAANSSPCGIAADASNIYWANTQTGTIGGAALDGTGVEQSLIGGLGVPVWVTVEGAHLYWIDFADGHLAEANLDGTGVDENLVQAGYTQPYGLAADALSSPIAGQTVGASPVSGTVLVKTPHATAFTPLTPGETIPLGSTVDATNGVVTLTSAELAKGVIDTGRFYGGSFRVSQVGAKAGLLTVLTLNGPKPAGCTTHAIRHLPGSASSARRRKQTVRELWSVTRGRFATVGHYALANGHASTWLTEDSCAGTRIHVSHGTVTVRDFPHHRSSVLKAPGSFTAHPGAGG
jgi:virginiamycin B lyase